MEAWSIEYSDFTELPSLIILRSAIKHILAHNILFFCVRTTFSFLRSYSLFLSTKEKKQLGPSVSSQGDSGNEIRKRFKKKGKENHSKEQRSLREKGTRRGGNSCAAARDLSDDPSYPRCIPRAHQFMHATTFKKIPRTHFNSRSSVC